MKQHSAPIIGNWYDSKNFPESFVVVDYDPQDYVEIQYHDGEIDKLDTETWNAWDPHEIAEPEDATAPYEIDIEHDDEIVQLLKEIEGQDDLEQHLHYIDKDEEQWN